MPKGTGKYKNTASFLTTRVWIPDKDDWGNLKRILRYVQWEINLTLILRSYSLPVIKWWVDASYMAHPDMRGHTGDTTPLGRFSITGISKKHRINAKISTEAELIRYNKVMPQILWT